MSTKPPASPCATTYARLTPLAGTYCQSVPMPMSSKALEREFQVVGHPEVRYALALALTELRTAGWLTKEAQLEVILASLEVRNWREETAQLELEALSVAALAHEVSY